MFLMSPPALELALRWPFSLGGELERPPTAESTLVSFSVMVVGDGSGDASEQECDGIERCRSSRGRRRISRSQANGRKASSGKALGTWVRLREDGATSHL